MFILRPDLQQVVEARGEASALFRQNNSLRVMLQKIRDDPAAYYKDCQHNMKLVRRHGLAAARRLGEEGAERQGLLRRPQLPIDHLYRSALAASRLT